MLGYEPTEIESELSIADYTKCAFDLGLIPDQFLEKHNPMFQDGVEVLRPYTTRISCFSNTQFQIVIINNSSAGFSKNDPHWQGTLHTAKILTPDHSKTRVINSTMMAPESAENGANIDLKKFLTTPLVRKRKADGSIEEINQHCLG